MRYFIELSYIGKAYHGWQNQPNAISVQQVLEEALSVLLQTKIEIVGAGRTDAGVHAKQMFAHFDVDIPFDIDQLKYKLNSFLPKDVAIHCIFKVKPDAHARFDASSRTYHYKISTHKNVFNFDFAYEMHLPLDVDQMNEACKILLKYNDFQCFSKSNTDVKTYHCSIENANWHIENDTLTFVITADRFLRNMVRAIVGTLINIGLGKMEVDDLHTIIKSKDRSEAGFSVPAHGLYLTKITYPDTISL
ncbi:tRNA pseudouridine38-40 synthase [Flavobacteriaceae bacterium MAR_2010_72]|nr:tRNA pseudouridine38-40 synthase [Flavobacteriaceae bacterium MAR_2010_72]TVZ57553.1 tRNA pseudouridine38-40 synthase [Flavobacteriaceae bacterium MAR_2010_105]